MSKHKKRGRIDFTLEKIELIGEDKDSVKYRIRMVPDKRSWKRSEINGKKGYLNKSEHIFISDEEFAKAVKTMKHIPIYVSPITITDEQEYIERSKRRVKATKE